MAAETKETYQLTVTRITRGEWEEREYSRVGENPDGTDKYANVPVVKPREKKEQVFLYEVPHEPDVEAMVRVMETKRKQA